MNFEKDYKEWLAQRRAEWIGQEVEFEVKDGPKGPQAAEIRPL